MSNLERITIRMNKDEKERIVAHAKLEGFTNASEYIRNAIANYLNKDVAWQGQVQGAIEALRRDNKKMAKTIEMYSLLFVHFTEYYFSYTPSLQNLSDKERLYRIQDGENRSKAMMNNFSKKLKGMPTFLETLLADQLIEEEK